MHISEQRKFVERVKELEEENAKLKEEVRELKEKVKKLEPVKGRYLK